MKRHEEVRPPEMDWPLLKARIAELEAEVARLTVKRDEWQAAWESQALSLDKQEARVAELEAERDESRNLALDQLLRGHIAAVLAEREACAQVAAERGIGHNAGPYAAGCIECAEEIAAAIRGRSAP